MTNHVLALILELGPPFRISYQMRTQRVVREEFNDIAQGKELIGVKASSYELRGSLNFPCEPDPAVP